MRYTVVTAEDVPQLNTLVNEFLLGGWRPAGGIAVDTSQPSKIFAQAMLAEDEAPAGMLGSAVRGMRDGLRRIQRVLGRNVER